MRLFWRDASKPTDQINATLTDALMIPEKGDDKKGRRPMFKVFWVFKKVIGLICLLIRRVSVMHHLHTTPTLLLRSIFAVTCNCAFCLKHTYSFQFDFIYNKLCCMKNTTVATRIK